MGFMTHWLTFYDLQPSQWRHIICIINDIINNINKNKEKTMAVITEDRPIETVRGEVVDQLTMNYGHGQLSLEAFERRLDQAMESKNNTDLLRLTADLDLVVDAAYVEQKNEELNTTFDLEDAKDSDTVVQIFGGSNRSGKWNVAKETNVFSLFSGCEIDLSEAQFQHKVITIKIFSLFSGHKIFTPENINVISKVSCIFGSIDNQAPSALGNNAPTVIVEGIAIFSGITIKFKQTLKEKMLRFADGLKKMFV
jgi:hypothetical protein